MEYPTARLTPGSLSDLTMSLEPTAGKRKCGDYGIPPETGSPIRALINRKTLRKLDESETRPIVRKVDEIFGLTSLASPD